MLPQAGDFRVVCTPDGQLPYMLVGPAGTPVEPVRDYLLELFASDCSPLTIKSYAFDLLDWRSRDQRCTWGRNRCTWRRNR